MGKADLHIHTNHSDGSATAAQVLHRAGELGLDTIAVTDHNEIAGAIKARELAERWGLKIDVILGEEITTSEGHVVGLFLKERIRPLMTARATVDEIHRQGGLAVAVHPFSLWLKLFNCGGVGRLAEWLQFDAIEVANGALTETFSNRYTKAYNNKVAKLAGVGGSDAHTIEALGQAYTVFPGRGAAWLRNAITHKATKAVISGSQVRALLDFIGDHLKGKLALYGSQGGALDQAVVS
ncbi:PHP domain-containing protein [candidate division TA06 bacterium]|uniref:PHP domain-containing protein n=1 Tax=candidate division TA06 bacterium TaxID=2250710 RepID=A0A933IBZ2_UNCT6|nr:PHP domain-containing protein [candidate division TA06 bacterium]